MAELRTLRDALTAAARTTEGYRFISGDRTIDRSYRELLSAALRVASALARVRLEPGDLVAIVIADAEQFLTAFFGISLAGLIPAPLGPPATAGDSERCVDMASLVMRTSGARALITTEALKALFDVTSILTIEALAASDSSVPTASATTASPISVDDIALVQFTSGSTSSPRGVAITHRNLCENVDAINGPGGLASSGSDSAVSWLPLYHDMGLIGMALGPLYCGRPAVLMPPALFVKRPVEWLRAISRHRATVSFAPNFAYDLCVRRVREHDLTGLDLSCWRVAGCGAEPIHAPTLAAFAERFASVGFRTTSFLPSYGLAEHVLAASFAPRDRPLRIDRVSADDLAGRRLAIPASGDGRTRATEIVSCGRALPRHSIAIVDGEGHEVPARHVGEIALAGPSVMRGYYKDDEQTAEAIAGRWLRTGDLGYLDEAGELFVCGRIKDIIIVHGRKYHPQDLEWAVDDLSGVRRGRVVALGVPGIESGADRIVIVLEPSGTVAPTALVDAVRRRIADSCSVHVDEVMIVTSGTISRTTSGKIRRTTTRDRYERGELELACAVK